jgi:hypothetical protein
MPTYLSPADNLIVDGKAYRPGDNVPVAGDVRTSLEVAGHRFEDSDEAEIASATVDAQAALMTATPAPPIDDRGAPVEEPEAPTARSKTATSTHATSHATASH